MKSKLTLAAFLSFALTADSIAATPLAKADLLRSVAPLVENNSLQAVSLGVVQAGNIVSVHAGALSPASATSPDVQTLPRIPAEIPSDDYRDPYATYGDVELWATLRRVKLDFPPGTKASYSNFAAGLLGTLRARTPGLPMPSCSPLASRNRWE
jgi:CubicO group peptidase (beta-lactamase class C family)